MCCNAKHSSVAGGWRTCTGNFCDASGFEFYNTSRYDFDRLLADAPNVAANLRNYIAGFSQNMREVLERFDFDNTISKLDEAGLLFQVLERFGNVDLHPDRIDNATMGTIFEELIRRVQRSIEREPRRALYAPRRDTPHGRPDAGGR